MKILLRYLPQEMYSEEGFFDPIKSIWNGMKDKFNKDINFKYNASTIEKDLQKTYLNDEWLDRRKWVNPRTTIVAHNATFLLNPELKNSVMTNASYAIQESSDWMKFFLTAFKQEHSFSLWLDDYGWRSNLRQIYQFNHSLKHSYGSQDVPTFRGKYKYIATKTEPLPPVLDYTAFKMQTQEMINLCKIIDQCKRILQPFETVTEWDADIYDALKSSIKDDFTEETEYTDHATGRTVITYNLVHEEEYLMVLNCLRRFDEFCGAVEDELNDKLLQPFYENLVELRDVMYRQLRGSFTG